MNIVFIINRFAGNGNGQKIAEYIENRYKNDQNVKIEYTLYRGHATEIARQYSNTNSLIYAVGGDGTLNEVVNGMMSTKCNSILSTVPCGSGRDFARNFTDEKDPKYFLQSNLEEYQIDVGEIDYGYSSRYFINAVAAGITAEIGTRRYLLMKRVLIWPFSAFQVLLLHHSCT
jgi:diacylglycerol kinase family enzyme